jgi:hypothetical protein
MIADLDTFFFERVISLLLSLLLFFFLVVNNVCYFYYINMSQEQFKNKYKILKHFDKWLERRAQ